ncbi:MAG: DUF5606 domain-containing protein, partial [Flavobacteriales bacterium]
LYRILVTNRSNLVVESMLDRKRLSIPGTSRISSLADITMYTASEDVPLRDILNRIHDAQKGEAGPSHKDGAQVIRDFVDGIVPELDHERVYQSDLKKLVQWYNLLVGQSAFPLEAPEGAEEAPAAEEAADEPAPEKKAPKKKAAAKKKPAAKKKEAKS